MCCISNATEFHELLHGFVEILKCFKKVIQKIQKNEGWPTKLTISLSDYLIQRIAPLWAKCQQ